MFTRRDAALVTRRDFFAVCAAAVGSVTLRGAGAELSLIPRPAAVIPRDGAFALDESVALVASAEDADVRRTAAMLNRQLAERLGRPLQVYDTERTGVRAIVLSRGDGEEGSSAESYRLEIGRDRVKMVAPQAAGLFYAGQTLAQLLPAQSGVAAGGRMELAGLSLSDAPRFGWRGLMLDCSRTFQSLPYLRRTIDRMALYKLNTLHLHLTDDQGWRLEVRRHPRLTEVGSRFAARFQQPEAYQGFYSQAEMRELIEYAAERHVTIVPEIEMPGHALAAVAVYPELSCSGGPFEIPPACEGEGSRPCVPTQSRTTPFCVGNDGTFQVLEEVLDEVAALFPSRYIHIGGDEVPKDVWLACPKCRRRMREEGLSTGEELQSYFIHRIERHVHALGKRLIGWDEILQGGLPPRATVMSWRGIEGGIAAASSGHDVVMCPTSHCYFDYDHQTTPLEKVYDFEPIPGELSPSTHHHLLGAQANFWSHIDRPEHRVDHQIYPRLLALAERVWSRPDVRDYAAFATRAKAHLPRLDALGIRYAPVL